MSYKILVIDDEEPVRELFRDLLHDQDCQTVCVAGGEEALEVINKEDFDLVLLDIKLSGMNGFDVLKKIKEFKPSLAVAMLTGFGYVEELVDLAERCGACGYISKNLPVAKIMDNIRGFVKAAHDGKRKAV